MHPLAYAATPDAMVALEHFEQSPLFTESAAYGLEAEVVRTAPCKMMIV